MKMNMLNAIVIGFSDNYLQKVIFNLTKEISIKKIITINPQRYREVFKLNSDQIVSQDEFNLIEKVRKIPINNLDIPSKEFFDKFSKYEKIFMTISDRLSYFPISVKERQDIFYKLLIYWVNELKEKKIDVILFDSTPHFCWDTLLYFIAKEFNVKTIYIERTLIEGKILLLNQFNNLPMMGDDFLGLKTRNELENEYGEDYFSILYKESVWIKYSKKINAKVVNSNNMNLNNLRKIIKSLVEIVAFILNTKKYKRSCFYLNHQPNKYHEALLRLKNTKKNNSLKKFYLENSTRELSGDYCVFYLQLQPERTTLPMADVFENQLLSIIMLSKSLPKGMTLYIKEHPRQFDNDKFTLKYRHFRDVDFYKQLLKISNIKFLNLSIENKYLIEGAKFVSTGTGSLGWEALLLGIPAVVFGHPWYKGCPSCFYVSSKQDIQKAIKKITGLNKEMVLTSVYKYYIFLNQYLIDASNQEKYVISDNLSIEKSIKNLSEGLILKLRDA